MVLELFVSLSGQLLLGVKLWAKKGDILVYVYDTGPIFCL